MKGRLAVVLAIGLLVAGNVYLGVQLASARAAWDRAAELSKERDQWKSQADQLSEELLDFKATMRKYPILHAVQIPRLKELTGSEDPVQWIIDDLMPRYNLIPIKGVLGGTTRFHENRTWLLDNHHVLADVTDGHITGWVVLEFDFDENGELIWETIAHWPWRP